MPRITRCIGATAITTTITIIATMATARMAVDRLIRGCLLAAVVAAAGAAQAAPAATLSPPPTPKELHASQCVAALEVETEALAKRVKAGENQLRDLLQAHIEAGTSFVGDAYLSGTRDEDRARALANQALEAQKSLPDAELTARQVACADEGAKIFAAGNGLERIIVKQVAKKRMKRMLGE